ncbi:MAG: bifunctional nuclease family protein [Candidatus Aenigmatarchaeota archaeon]
MRRRKLPSRRKVRPTRSRGVTIASIRRYARRHMAAGSVMLAIVVLAVATYMMVGGSKDPVFVIPELFTYGYTQVSVDAGMDSEGGVVTLTAGCRQIRAHVEPSQAESIYMAIQGVVSPRPNAHDIVADAFDSLGIEVLMVKVTDLRNQTFYGKIILRNGNRVANLDARPSDATAIALRMHVPVYVKTQLLEENGEKIC